MLPDKPGTELILSDPVFWREISGSGRNIFSVLK